MNQSPRQNRLKFAAIANEAEFRQDLEHFKRAKTLKQNDPEHFAQTELLRNSFVQVQERALQEREKASPRRYDKVKSKVIGNLNSQKKAKKNQRRVADRKAYDMDMVGKL